MPRSLWVIEVLQPKVRGEGNEWVPCSWEPTKRDAREYVRVWLRKEVQRRVRRWSPVEGR